MLPCLCIGLADRQAGMLLTTLGFRTFVLNHSSLPSLSRWPVLMWEMSFTSFSLIAIGEQPRGPLVQDRWHTPPLSPS